MQKSEFRRESIDMPNLEAGGGAATATSSTAMEADPSAAVEADPSAAVEADPSAAVEADPSAAEAVKPRIKNGVNSGDQLVQATAETEKDMLEEEEEKQEEKAGGGEEEEEESLKDVNNDLEMSSDEDSRQDSDLDEGDKVPLPILYFILSNTRL